MLNKTHLIKGSSKIISSENLAKKQLFSAEKTYFLFPHFLYTQLFLTPLEHYPFLLVYDSEKCMAEGRGTPTEGRGTLRDGRGIQAGIFRKRRIGIPPIFRMKLRQSFAFSQTNCQCVSRWKMSRRKTCNYLAVLTLKAFNLSGSPDEPSNFSSLASSSSSSSSSSLLPVEEASSAMIESSLDISDLPGL